MAPWVLFPGDFAVLKIEESSEALCKRRVARPRGEFAHRHASILAAAVSSGHSDPGANGIVKLSVASQGRSWPRRHC